MKIEARIKVAAAIALATAMWIILPDWRSHVFFFRDFGGFADIAGFSAVVSVVLFQLVLFAQIISALALFRGLRWAWILAIVALSVQVLFASLTAIGFFFFPPSPAPPVEGDVAVITISLWPCTSELGLMQLPS